MSMPRRRIVRRSGAAAVGPACCVAGRTPGCGGRPSRPSGRRPRRRRRGAGSGGAGCGPAVLGVAGPGRRWWAVSGTGQPRHAARPPGGRPRARRPPPWTGSTPGPRERSAVRGRRCRFISGRSRSVRRPGQRTRGRCRRRTTSTSAAGGGSGTADGGVAGRLEPTAGRGGLAAGAGGDPTRRGVHAGDGLDRELEVLVRGAAPGVHDRVGALLEVEVGRADRHGVGAGEHDVGARPCRPARSALSSFGLVRSVKPPSPPARTSTAGAAASWRTVSRALPAGDRGGVVDVRRQDRLAGLVQVGDDGDVGAGRARPRRPPR